MLQVCCKALLSKSKYDRLTFFIVIKVYPRSISVDLTVFRLIIIIIIFFLLLPPTFEKFCLRHFATCRNGVSAQVSYSIGLFGSYTASRNYFPLQSFLPFREKPCYHLNSETVKDS